MPTRQSDKNTSSAPGMAKKDDKFEDDPFVGTSDEYKNYASPAGQPFASEEGPEKELEDRLLAQQVKELPKSENPGEKGLRLRKEREAASKKEDKDEELKAPSL